jgi:hypothetical protein
MRGLAVDVRNPKPLMSPMDFGLLRADPRGLGAANRPGEGAGFGGVCCICCVAGRARFGITIVKLSSSPRSKVSLSIMALLSSPFLCRNGMVPGSWWLCDRTNGFTMVNSSSFAGLTAGLPCREPELAVLELLVLCPNLDLLRIGLTLGLFWVCDRGRATLFGATVFFVVVTAAVFSGVIDGVTLPVPLRRTAYGSAVAGLVSSGRRIGRRTVPLINEPVPAEFFSADLVASPDIADGGRAGPDDAVDAFEAVLLAPSDFVDVDLTGE